MEPLSLDRKGIVLPPGSILTIADGAHLSVDALNLEEGSALILDNGLLSVAELSIGRKASLSGLSGKIDAPHSGSAKLITGAEAYLDLRSIFLNLCDKGSLTMGAGSVLRLADGVLTASVVDSPDGVSSIDAPERHVLNVKSFKGKWHAPQAYAKWFVEDPEGDWAPAINNALKIDTEAVHLPGRLCRISKTIQMPVKSRLIGCTRGETQIGNICISPLGLFEMSIIIIVFKSYLIINQYG